MDHGKEGTKRVEIAAVDDKRQITAVFACSMSGKFLLMQLIYKGTTKRCLPKDVNFPSDRHITHTENHWANEVTTIAYLRNVIRVGQYHDIIVYRDIEVSR